MIAPDEITVEVTPEDITSGNPGSLYSCPIALALCRQFGFTPAGMDDSKIIVESGDIGIVFNPDHPDEFDPYIMPVKARQFVEHFDNLEPVSPFTFTAVHWSPS